MKDIHESIEFFIPIDGLDINTYIQKEDKIGVHHLIRYLWAIEVARHVEIKNILDIACGIGYGSFLLAKKVDKSKVFGFDYDIRAVFKAKNKYMLNNLTYAVGDIETWKTEDNREIGKYDMIISFDTIEHLLHRELAFENIADNLNDDGLFLFSTPCHPDILLNPKWEHHKIEYSYEFLYKTVKRYFSTVISPDDDEFIGKEIFSKLNRDKIIYSNAYNPLICKNPIKITFQK